MGYPWGDESYPTIEQLESDPAGVRSSFYANLDSAQRELDRRFDEIRSQHPTNIHIEVSGSNLSRDEISEIVDDAVQRALESRYDVYPSNLELAECYGSALMRMLIDYGIDDPDNSIARFFQDLFNVIEDRAISRFDRIGSRDIDEIVREHEINEKERRAEIGRRAWEYIHANDDHALND